MTEPDQTTRDDPGGQELMSVGEHLEELRRRIIYALAGLLVGVAAALLFTEAALEVLKGPYVRVMREFGHDGELVVLSAPAAFLSYLRVAVLLGLIVASPWIFTQLWLFVSAGLYPHERRPVLVVIPVSVVLFVTGAAFFLFVVAEATMRFFISFNEWLGIRQMITLPNHIAFMTNLMLVFGLAFQMPLVVYFLARLGLVSRATFSRYRRHVVIGLLILAAAVTSPSPVDQIALTVPMWILYELGVLMAWVSERRQRKRQQREA